jgi:Fic family protein
MLYRSAEAAAKTLDQDVLKSLSKSEQKGWQWLATQGRTSSSHYADTMKIESRTARRHLNRFEELGLVRKTGSGPSIEYEVI